MSERYLWLKNPVSTVTYLESLSVEHCMKITASQLKRCSVGCFLLCTENASYPTLAQAIIKHFKVEDFNDPQSFNTGVSKV